MPRRSPLAGLPTEVGALVGVAFMVALGFGVVAPAIPLFARQFGVSASAAGAVVSIFAAARLVTAPLAGRLVNAFGERTMLATGIGIVAGSSLLAGLSQQYWQLLLLRGAGGIGSIMFSVSGIGLLIRVTPPHLRGRAQGTWAGGFLLGTIAGPALGVVASVSLRAPFFLYAGTLLVAAAVGLTALRGSELAARGSARAEVMTLRSALAQRRYRAAVASNFADQWAVIGTRVTLVPLFVVGPLGLATGWTYVASFTVSAVSGALLWPTGRTADRRGRLPVLLAGLLAAAAGLALLPVLPGTAGLLAAMVLLGVGGACLSVAPGAIVGDVVGGRGGSVVATYQMSGDLGAVTGPLAAGWLVDHHGFPTAFTVCAVVTLLVVPVALAARREPGVAAGAGPPGPASVPPGD